MLTFLAQCNRCELRWFWLVWACFSDMWSRAESVFWLVCILVCCMGAEVVNVMTLHGICICKRPLSAGN